jgi:4-hydroxybenzoate polyprenyltransferase
MSGEGTKSAPDEAAASVAGRGVFRTATTKGFVEALRPWDWTKNGFVFSALIFSRNATHGRATLAVTLSAIVFCLASSAGYLFNDVLDMEEDRRHPVKRSRPVASGRLTHSNAVAAATVLDAAALAMAWKLGAGFFLVILSYVVLNALYSGFLKHVVLLDVFVIAAGFVLRVLGGGVVIHVAISSWLIVCTTLLALFLALGKRRHELVLLGADASNHRRNLTHYDAYFLDQLIVIVTASTLISYALYTLSPDVRAEFPGKHLELTVPFVLFGIFRYLLLLRRGEAGGNPAQVLLTDRVMVTVVLLWAASVVALIYL